MNNPPKVLVVDATPANVLLLSKLLRWAGYVVLVAENGREGYDFKCHNGQI